jgi:acyl-CoA thioester hydrolase
MYTKEFEIRWSDIDANRHLANSAYLNFMSHTRMAFLLEYGFTMQMMGKHSIGPVIFHEHIHYFKEAFQGQPITVSLEVSGLSENASFFRFEHNFYNHKGENLAFCEILGAWMNLKERKITKMPEELIGLVDSFPKSEHFKTLTKQDTRAHGRLPKNLNL